MELDKILSKLKVLYGTDFWVLINSTYAAVGNGDITILINRNNEMIQLNDVGNVTYLSEEVFETRTKSKPQHVKLIDSLTGKDKLENESIFTIVDFIFNNNSYLAIRNMRSLKGIADMQGNIIVPIIYRDIIQKGEILVVSKNTEYKDEINKGVLNKEFEKITECVYDSITRFYGLVICYKTALTDVYNINTKKRVYRSVNSNTVYSTRKSSFIHKGLSFEHYTELANYMGLDYKELLKTLCSDESMQYKGKTYKNFIELCKENKIDFVQFIEPLY